MRNFEGSLSLNRLSYHQYLAAGAAAVAAVSLVGSTPGQAGAVTEQFNYPVRIFVNQYGQTSAKPGDVVLLGLEGQSNDSEPRPTEARITSNVQPIPFARIDGWKQNGGDGFAGPNFENSWFMWNFDAQPAPGNNNSYTSVGPSELFLKFRMPTKATLGKLGLKQLCAYISYDVPGLGRKPRTISECWGLAPTKSTTTAK